MSNVVTVTVEAQDLIKGMIATDGSTVFKIRKVVPLPGFQTAQVVTTRGRVINFKVADTLKVRGYVKL